MGGHQPDDALGFGRRDALPGVMASFGGAIDPEPPVGIQHRLQHRRIGEGGGDGWPKGCAQHLLAAATSLFGSDRVE